MAKWTFEPGHTSAEFCARHMMVTNVRGHFKNIRGTLDYDPQRPATCAVAVVIDATSLWTGDAERDAHLKSADFLDVQRFPEIRFRGGDVKLLSENECELTGELTIRDVTRRVTLLVRYHGTWETGWWEDGVDKGPKTRAGYEATTRINRHDFGVSWNSALVRGGIVVSDEVSIVIDAEAILD